MTVADTLAVEVASSPKADDIVYIIDEACVPICMV